MIAKLVNGNLVRCPKNGVDSNGVFHTNLPLFYEQNPEIAAAAGYYPVQYTAKPDGDCAQSWTLQNGEIVQTWMPYTPEPEPEDTDAAWREMIEECLLELSEAIYA